MEGIPNSVRDSVDPFVHSISTHYSCFEKMDWFVALQKAGCKKNRVIVIRKKKEASNNDPGFLHPAVSNPYFGPFFRVPF